MSKTTFLGFEQPIAELEGKIEELRFVQDDSASHNADHVETLLLCCELLPLRHR